TSVGGAWTASSSRMWRPPIETGRLHRLKLPPMSMSSDLSLHRLAPPDYQAWDDYVLAHPQATFFHRAGWQRIIESVFSHPTFFLYAQRAGRVVGVLPLAQVRSRLFGNSLSSLPFAVYGGVLADDAEAAAALEREAERIAGELGVEHLEFRNLQAHHADW